MGTRYVATGKETSYGVAVAAAYYEEAKAALKPDLGWLIPKPVASRAYRTKSEGPYRTRGNIGDFPLITEGIIGHLLYGAFGSISTANQTTGVYRHTFTPAETLPSLTVRLGVEQTQRILPGCLVNTLKLHFPNNDSVQANAEILSGIIESKAAIGTPTPSNVQAINMCGSECGMTIGGVTKRDVVFDLEFTLENKIPFERGALDGRTFSKKRYGDRTIKGKLSAYFDDTTEYDRFMAGTEFSIMIHTSGPLIIDPYYHYLEIEMRKCVYLKDVAPGVEPQSEPLVVDAPIQAFHDTTGGFNAEAKAVLQNTINSY